MHIRFLAPCQNSHGSFRTGDEAELPDDDAAPIVAAGWAEKLTKSEAAEAEGGGPAKKGKK